MISEASIAEIMSGMDDIRKQMRMLHKELVEGFRHRGSEERLIEKYIELWNYADEAVDTDEFLSRYEKAHMYAEEITLAHRYSKQPQGVYG